MHGITFGPYELIKRLGSQEHRRCADSVMEVWHAVDTVAERHVALRLVGVELSDDEHFGQRFEDHIAAARQFSGPHCVQIHSHGRTEDRLFVATQWVAGRDLGTMIRTGPLDPGASVQILEQVAEALDAIHSRGLVHDNVRPSTVLVTECGDAYLDVISIRDEVMDRSQSLFGTEPDPFDRTRLHYMAPERLRNVNKEGGHSDVYSLTCVLYECLTGSRPFDTENLEQLITGHLFGTPANLSELRPGLPKAMDRVIAGGLSKDPAARFSTASELILATRTALGAQAASTPSSCSAQQQLSAMLDESATAPIPIVSSGEIGSPSTNLRDLLAVGPLHPVRAIDIVVNVAAALEAVHQQGRLHGEGPDHIELQAHDAVRLSERSGAPLDFDSLDEIAASNRSSYTAPECFTTDVPGPGADIYSLTCVLFECLTGGKPFAYDNFARRMMGHLSEPIPRPSAHRPDLPAAFDRIVARGMAKNPGDRYRTAAQFAQEVQAVYETNYWHLRAANVVHPAVDSVTRPQFEALQDEPRILVVTATDEKHFVETLFPHVDPRTRVVVSRETRDGQSRGPHFDVYQSIVHPAYPYVATLNLTGSATVESTVLPPRLASYYFKHHPVPTENAYTARRLVSALALQDPRARVARHFMRPGTGMIIPQQDRALPVVHDVRPQPADGPDSAGLFLKFLVPRADAEAFAAAEGQGFTPWQPGSRRHDAGDRWYDASELPFVPPPVRYD